MGLIYLLYYVQNNHVRRVTLFNTFTFQPCNVLITFAEHILDARSNQGHSQSHGEHNLKVIIIIMLIIMTLIQRRSCLKVKATFSWRRYIVVDCDISPRWERYLIETVWTSASVRDYVPRRMLPPGESRWVCAARFVKFRTKTGQTDGRTPDRYVTLTAGRRQRNTWVF